MRVDVSAGLCVCNTCACLCACPYQASIWPSRQQSLCIIIFSSLARLHFAPYTTVLNAAFELKRGPQKSQKRHSVAVISIRVAKRTSISGAALGTVPVVLQRRSSRIKAKETQHWPNIAVSICGRGLYSRPALP